MDYQQSFRNLDQLKNFIRPWTDCYIFFFFYSETEFQVEIYGVDLTVEQQDKIDKNVYGNFPYGYMSIGQEGNETLYYHDKKIIIVYDTFADKLRDVDFQDPVDIKAARAQFLQLFKILENE
jgi:hypothetical protein